MIAFCVIVMNDYFIKYSSTSSSHLYMFTSAVAMPECDASVLRQLARGNFCGGQLVAALAGEGAVPA